MGHSRIPLCAVALPSALTFARYADILSKLDEVLRRLDKLEARVDKLDALDGRVAALEAARASPPMVAVDHALSLAVRYRVDVLRLRRLAQVVNITQVSDDLNVRMALASVEHPATSQRGIVERHLREYEQQAGLAVWLVAAAPLQ